MLLAALIVCAYLVGSVPVGYLIAKANGVDILHSGSGNIGATNVFRVMGDTGRGKILGLSVFLLDVLKGLLPAVAGYVLLGHSQLAAFGVGLGAVAGHCLSPFLRFKGGKGVATGLGVVFGACPLVALSAFLVFLILLALTRYVSLASLIAALSLVPFGLLYGIHGLLDIALAALALFVIYRHRANILRLMSRTEPHFSFRTKPSKAQPDPPEVAVSVGGVSRAAETSAPQQPSSPDNKKEPTSAISPPSTLASQTEEDGVRSER